MRLTRNVVVGIFLIGGVVLFGAGLFLIGGENQLFSHTFRAYAYFSNVSGLSSGAQIQISGFQAGSVTDIRVAQQTPPRFQVTLGIDRRFRPLVRQNSVATITSQGMVGDQFVEISPASDPGPECPPGCTIQSKEPVSLSDLVSEGQGVMQVLKSTLSSAGQVAQHANQAISTFDARGQAGETGPEHLRQTVAEAQQAANNIAEDTEALKHNFFLRGFFKRRGFYSLEEMTPEQYRKGDFVKEKKSRRVWVGAQELFASEHGKAELTEAGRQELEKAMAGFFSYLPNSALMIEGYSDSGPAAQQYRESEERATAVRDYLIGHFSLKSDYVGAMPLSSAPPEHSGKDSWNGVCLVLLIK